MQPEENRLLRKIDEMFVQSLKDNLRRDPMGPGIHLTHLYMYFSAEVAFKDQLTLHMHAHIILMQVLHHWHYCANPSEARACLRSPTRRSTHMRF